MLERVLKRKHIEVRHPAPGQRHNTETIYVYHKYPVKGGISANELIAIQMARTNKLLEFVKRRGYRTPA